MTNTMKARSAATALLLATLFLLLIPGVRENVQAVAGQIVESIATAGGWVFQLIASVFA